MYVIIGLKKRRDYEGRGAGIFLPACFFSAGVPLRWRISSSTRPRDINPKVSPDIIPANRTRKHEIPAYRNHNADPNAIDPNCNSDPTAAPSLLFIRLMFLVAIRIRATALTTCIFDRSDRLLHSLTHTHTFFFSLFVSVVFVCYWLWRYRLDWYDSEW